jgi:2-amino-4-hydroxy-6-hydroxymethyldihydropteridine diphosphokinase
MFKVYLILGGNLGDRSANLHQAEALIGKHVGEVVKMSSVYETEAWGKTDQPTFLNQVLIAETKLTALKVLGEIHEIETLLGRKREEHWGARTIDIDILFYENEIINLSNLVIPHPYITKRRFVLAPLLETIPDFIHPVLKKTIKELYSGCEDNIGVKKYKIV